MDEVTSKLSSLNEYIENIYKRLDNIDRRVDSMIDNYFRMEEQIRNVNENIHDVEGKVSNMERKINKRLLKLDNCGRDFRSVDQKIASLENITTLRDSIIQFPSSRKNDPGPSVISAVNDGHRNEMGEAIVLNNIESVQTGVKF